MPQKWCQDPGTALSIIIDPLSIPRKWGTVTLSGVLYGTGFIVNDKESIQSEVDDWWEVYSATALIIMESIVHPVWQNDLSPEQNKIDTVALEVSAYVMWW